MERNNEKWDPAAYAPMDPAERNVYTMDEAVDQLKTWLHDRGAWYDVNVDALNAFAHPSRNKEFNN